MPGAQNKGQVLFIDLKLPGISSIKKLFYQRQLTRPGRGGQGPAQGGQALLAASLQSALAPHVPPHVLPEDGADDLDDADLALWHTAKKTTEEP